MTSESYLFIEIFVHDDIVKARDGLWIYIVVPACHVNEINLYNTTNFETGNASPTTRR